ncbi:hypothetical protein COCVIDRAFT_36573 [Bipolaris victoriae FI3]|uniref:Uncharacterized protein n=1 Tax=Bipolaris victoriae (strain FI3) TaxID=930091 RepID=W7EMY6_BIPV3|nr:hypothetical protein COCVIDRAFT_36573 [Bipolaris victoriae FI3]
MRSAATWSINRVRGPGVRLGSLGHISGPNRPEPQRAALLTIQVSLDHVPESNSETYPGVTASGLRLVPPHASFHGQHQGDAAQVIPDSWSSSSHCCQYSGGATRQH